VKRVRIEYDGAYYHVSQRGNNHESIFLGDEEKNYYLKLLMKYKKQYSFKLLGYVLMDNHYHLLIQTGVEPLNKIMHRINSLYSRYYNKKNNRSGHVFSDRYAAGLIQDEHYLFSVLRYIHWNPVRAGLSLTAEDYKWSSDHVYRNNDDTLVDINFVLNIFSLNNTFSHETYRQMMKTASDDEESYEEMHLIGDESFRTSKKEDCNPIKELKDPLIGRKSLGNILSETGASADDIDLIKGGSRQRHLKLYKLSYVHAAVTEGYTFKETGRFIGISDTAVNKLISI